MQLPGWEIGLTFVLEPRLPGTQLQEIRTCSHHSLCIPKQKRREEGGHTQSAKASPGGLLWMSHLRLPFCHNTELVIPERMDMALLSNIPEAYSFMQVVV